MRARFLENNEFKKSPHFPSTYIHFPIRKPHFFSSDCQTSDKLYALDNYINNLYQIRPSDILPVSECEEHYVTNQNIPEMGKTHYNNI